MTRVVEVETPAGLARLHVDVPAAPDPRAPALLLGHGAGNGVDTADLEALAAGLSARGVVVVRLEQPWKVAGRRVATPPATLDAGLRAVVPAVRDLAGLDAAAPLVVGGRSAGARSALRCARGIHAIGVLALAFPLHPPGRPERSRLAELQDAGVPTLVVQGERDPFGRPEELPDPLPAHVRLHVVPAADHALRTAARGPVSTADALAAVVAAVAAWIDDLPR
ncbi:hydrolase [Nocardioides sp. TRM66260-LWL]|uniref:alpha/beta hydrolase family protein n=1 Tax=Nocardioides sp. TRM66260-LWL TaxID=2874478 RepID=UPI001CC70887|nr:alpha/beta family hydrolase [Nocardioides sp. TRM66260-LWL]MBZ5734293.1 hydrolase [Nocardioides sp. TRM66260-LWL]